RSLRRGFFILSEATPLRLLRKSLRRAAPSGCPGSHAGSGRPPSHSGLADVSGLQTFRAARDLELHTVTLGQALESGSLDGAVVDEHVLPAFLRDEPETLRVVEPLHCSLCHNVSSSSVVELHAPVIPGRYDREVSFRGTGCPRCCSIVRSCASSSGAAKLVARPLASARAVRPIRWM